MPQARKPDRVAMIREIAERRLRQHMGAMDATMVANAEMSYHKQPGKFAEVLEEVLREALMDFDAEELVARAMQRAQVHDAF